MKKYILFTVLFLIGTSTMANTYKFSNITESGIYVGAYGELAVYAMRVSLDSKLGPMSFVNSYSDLDASIVSQKPINNNQYFRVQQCLITFKNNKLYLTTIPDQTF